MRLAKDALDVGLLTDDPELCRFFQDAVGLAPPERLDVAPGVVQHRFDAVGSILKVNVVADLPIETRSGYREVLLAGEGFGAPRRLEGPDGIRVTIVSPGEEGVSRLGVRLAVPDRAAAEGYFGEGLGWEVQSGRVQVGSSVILLDASPDAPAAVSLPVRGWTYLTVQVFDCDAVTAEVVGRGASLAAEARNLGDVARFSMVADPFGNQLEISERASVTGRPIRENDGS